MKIETNLNKQTAWAAEILATAPDCYGVTQICDAYSLQCKSCKQRYSCSIAVVTITMAAAYDPILKGIDKDVRRQVNRVGPFLPSDFTLPKMPLSESDMAFVHALYHRGISHLAAINNYIEEQLGELDETITIITEDSIAEAEIPVAINPDENLTAKICSDHSTLIAPRFRPRTKTPWKARASDYTEEEIDNLRERQLDDLKWLYQSGKRDQIKEGIYAELFTSEAGLDLKLATQFVRTGGSAEQKLETLKLDQLEQVQMSYFETKALRDKIRSVEKLSVKIEAKLKEQAILNRRFERDVGGFIQLWKANKIAGHLGNRAVGELLGWMTGVPPLDESTIRKKLKRLEKRLT